MKIKITETLKYSSGSDELNLNNSLQTADEFSELESILSTEDVNKYFLTGEVIFYNRKFDAGDFVDVILELKTILSLTTIEDLSFLKMFLKDVTEKTTSEKTVVEKFNFKSNVSNPEIDLDLTCLELLNCNFSADASPIITISPSNFIEGRSYELNILAGIKPIDGISPSTTTTTTTA